MIFLPEAEIGRHVVRQLGNTLQTLAVIMRIWRLFLENTVDKPLCSVFYQPVFNAKGAA